MIVGLYEYLAQEDDCNATINGTEPLRQHDL